MNFPVNGTDFNLTKGVSNEVLFFVKTADRVPVTANAMTALGILDVRIIVKDTRTDTLLLGTTSYPADGDVSVLSSNTAVDPAKGVWKLSLSASDIQDWPLGSLSYGIICDRSGGDQIMLYTDRNYGPYSGLKVLPGPFPQPAEAKTVLANDCITIGSSKYSGALIGAAQIGNLTGIHSVVANVASFTGSITIQGSLENSVPSNDSDWFLANVVSSTNGTITAGTVTFNTMANGPVYISTVGNYMWERVIVMTATGTYHSFDYRAD